MLFRTRSVGCLLLCLAFLVGPAFFIFGIQSLALNPPFWLVAAFLPKKRFDVTPLTTQAVLLKFTESAISFQIKDTTSRMLALKETCIHPSTRIQYIKSITGGKDNSIENLPAGITHALILQFSSNEDRNYYASDDPVHQEFKDAAAAFLEKTAVVDFQGGVSTRADSED